MQASRVSLNQPVETYDVTQYFKEHAAYLRSDLASNHLEVSLAPADPQRFVGHMIRVVDEENPPWYRSFYHREPGVRRDRTESSLERIIAEEDAAADEFPFATYDKRVRGLIYDHLTKGYETKQGRVPPRNDFLEAIGRQPVRGGYMSTVYHGGLTERESTGVVEEAPF